MEIKDRVARGDNKYLIQELNDGTGRKALIHSPDEVIEAGTPVNRALLQPLFDGLERLDEVNQVVNQGKQEIQEATNTSVARIEAAQPIQLANNLTTTTSGKAIDAAQGPIIAEQLKKSGLKIVPATFSSNQIRVTGDFEAQADVPFLLDLTTSNLSFDSNTNIRIGSSVLALKDFSGSALESIENVGQRQFLCVKKSNYIAIELFQSKLEKRTNEAFQSARDGKIKLADAITSKGQVVDNEASFEAMADSIREIQVGKYDVGDILLKTSFNYFGKISKPADFYFDTEVSSKIFIGLTSKLSFLFITQENPKYIYIRDVSFSEFDSSYAVTVSVRNSIRLDIPLDPNTNNLNQTYMGWDSYNNIWLYITQSAINGRQIRSDLFVIDSSTKQIITSFSIPSNSGSHFYFYPSEGKIMEVITTNSQETFKIYESQNSRFVLSSTYIVDKSNSFYNENNGITITLDGLVGYRWDSKKKSVTISIFDYKLRKVVKTFIESMPRDTPSVNFEVDQFNNLVKVTMDNYMYNSDNRFKLFCLDVKNRTIDMLANFSFNRSEGNSSFPYTLSSTRHGVWRHYYQYGFPVIVFRGLKPNQKYRLEKLFEGVSYAHNTDGPFSRSHAMVIPAMNGSFLFYVSRDNNRHFTIFLHHMLEYIEITK